MAQAFKVKFSQSEVAKLKRKFDRVEKTVRMREVSKAVRQTLKPVVADMRSRVPVDSGTLRDAITSKTKGYRRNGIVFGVAGIQSKIRKIDGRDRNPAKYAHLVEYGTAAHGVKNKKVMAIKGVFIFGKRVKGTRPRPFVRPTWDGNKGSMERNVRSKIGKAIERVAGTISV